MYKITKVCDVGTVINVENHGNRHFQTMGNMNSLVSTR